MTADAALDPAIFAPGLPDLYAVTGNPVAHSRSPEIHAAFARQTDQSLRYERLLCPLDGFEASLRRFVDAGLKGCNVTVPFKFEAFALAQRRTPRAQLAGAVNTLRFDADGWIGDNTDGGGLLTDIERNAGRPLRGRRVLLVGAGGASAGVLGSLIGGRPAELRVVNRTADKALALVESHRDWAAQHGVALSAGGLDEVPGASEAPFDILINGTSASLSGAGSPLPERDTPVLALGGLAVDMMYGTKSEPFMAWARREVGPEGIVIDGLGMLVEQAAESFLLWRGVRPDAAAVLATVRRSLEAGR